MRNVYLIGMMGAGKSSVGRPLARLLKYRFADSDAAVEARAGRSIAELFAAKGEASFRRLEGAVIRGLSRQSRLVVALGGGAVKSAENRAAIKGGAVVLLSCREPELWRRLRPRSGARPLLAGGRPALRRLLKERRALYRACADVTVSTTDRSPLAAARLIKRRLA